MNSAPVLLLILSIRGSFHETHTVNAGTAGAHVVADDCHCTLGTEPNNYSVHVYINKAAPNFVLEDVRTTEETVVVRTRRRGTNVTRVDRNLSMAYDQSGTVRRGYRYLTVAKGIVQHDSCTL